MSFAQRITDFGLRITDYDSWTTYQIDIGSLAGGELREPLYVIPELVGSIFVDSRFE